jgi:hypothetical protein
MRSRTLIFVRYEKFGRPKRRSVVETMNAFHECLHICTACPQTPLCDHKKCGKCILYSNAEADDIQAMREAGISAAERYKAEIQMEDGASEVASKVDFDVEQMLHDPAQPPVPPQMPVPPAPQLRRGQRG